MQSIFDCNKKRIHYLFEATFEAYPLVIYMVSRSLEFALRTITSSPMPCPRWGQACLENYYLLSKKNKRSGLTAAALKERR